MNSNILKWIMMMSTIGYFFGFCLVNKTYYRGKEKKEEKSLNEKQTFYSFLFGWAISAVIILAKWHWC